MRPLIAFSSSLRRRVIEANFTSALNYFLEHPYKRSQSATTSNQTSSSVDETLSKAGTGLLKVGSASFSN